MVFASCSSSVMLGMAWASKIKREDVVTAAREGQFHIYPVSTVDEAIAVLTGVDAGDADAQEEYPAESVNGKVKRRLEDFAETRHEFAKPGDDDQDDEHKSEDKEKDKDPSSG